MVSIKKVEVVFWLQQEQVKRGKKTQTPKHPNNSFPDKAQDTFSTPLEKKCPTLQYATYNEISYPTDSFFLDQLIAFSFPLSNTWKL